MHSESLRFANMNEFYEWKRNVEKETICQFIKMRRDQTKRETTSVFSCHRSGPYVPKMAEKIRRSKLQGSKKLNGFCPAEITVRENRANGVCLSTYIKTHVGHAIADETELAHVYLNREERESIAEKIAAGMSFEQITNAMCVDGETDDKLRLLSNHDLHNIAASYNLKVVRRRENSSANAGPTATDVDEFASRYADSILYYKKEGEIDDTFHCLRKNDVVVIMMTETQRSALHKFGHNVIAIDETYDAADGDRFLLQTLLVVDDYLEGFACAFAISNRNDDQMTNVFLRCVRENSDDIQPSCLITDTGDSRYKSWLENMSPPRHRLFSRWHVRRAWRKSLQTISNKEAYRRVRLELENLSMEPDEHEFLAKIEQFFQLEDEDTESFFDYFRNHCVESARLWAHCYRLNVDGNANVYMESFDNILKHLRGECKKIKNLVDGLNVLREYSIQKERLLKIKEIRGRVNGKLKTLRKRHDLMLETFDTTIQRIEKSEVGDYWLVFTCTPATVDNERGVVEIFYVRCISESCCPVFVGCKLVCEKCHVCAHQYKCSCPDSSIKNNMCQHVHAVCSRLENCLPVTVVPSPPLSAPAAGNDEDDVTTFGFALSTTNGSTCDLSSDSAVYTLVTLSNEVSFSNILSHSTCILSSGGTADTVTQPFTVGSDDQISVSVSNALDVSSSSSSSANANEFETEKMKLKLALMSAVSAVDMASSEEELDVIKQLVDPTFSSNSTENDYLVESYSLVKPKTET